MLNLSSIFVNQNVFRPIKITKVKHGVLLDLGNTVHSWPTYPTQAHNQTKSTS